MEYLAHHGIKGQKWGVRRYQNPDGSLTMEGKLRYTIYTDSDGNTTHRITKTSDNYAKPKSKDNPYSARRTVKIHKARENLAEAARAKVAADDSGDSKRQRSMQRRLNSETDKYMRATKDSARSDQVTYQHMDDAWDMLDRGYITKETFNKLYDAQLSTDVYNFWDNVSSNGSPEDYAWLDYWHDIDKRA